MEKVFSSSETLTLILPRTRLCTIGDQSFCVTAAHAWNNLPTSVTTTTSHITLYTISFTYLLFTIQHNTMQYNEEL